MEEDILTKNQESTKDVKTFQWIKCKLLLSLPPSSL